MGCGINSIDVKENEPIKKVENENIINSNDFKKYYGLNENDMKIINSEALKFHNNYREKHNAKQLELSKYLCKKAQKKVYELVNEIENKTNYSEEDNKFGENLFISLLEDVNIENACQSWYNEEKLYNYDLDNYQKGTTHFTQMVWKGTKEVGFGYSKFKNGKSYFLAIYSPSGNELFKFKENVGKKSDKYNQYSSLIIE